MPERILPVGWLVALALSGVLAGCGGHDARLTRSPFHTGANNAILRVATSCPNVALTFDDGPLPGATARLLEVLAAHGAVATFFDVGRNARAHPDLVAREIAAGSQVGDHSFTHARLPRLSGAALAEEFSRTRAALKAAGARSIHLFRPPFGFFDGRVQAAGLAHGETTIGWDLVLEPHRHGRSPAAVARRARPGSIILAHDFDESSVGPLVRGLQRRGLRLVTVSELLSGRCPRR